MTDVVMVAWIGGIDRRLGGVHLAAGSRMWRWDDERQRVIESA